jgi:uncharacterized protein
MTTKAENKLDGKLNLNKFPASTTKFYELNHEQDWLKTLLLELSEKVEEKSIEEKMASTNISAEFEIIKKFKQEYGDYILIKGHVIANYLAQCVRTLEWMDETVEIEVQVAFLAGHLEKTEAFQDLLEIYETGDMYELYYFQKGIADIEEMIHEQIFLHVNQYPIKDSEAPLPDSGTQQ